MSNKEGGGHGKLELLRLLALGEQEILEGKGFELDEVLADADALIREHSERHPDSVVEN